MPANTKAALTDEQKKTLRFDEQPGFLARAQPYPAPDADLDKKMQDVMDGNDAGAVRRRRGNACPRNVSCLGRW